MIRFALRLALAGGREALIRLAVIAGAVTLGTSLLLAALAGVHAVNATNDRYAWLNTGAVAAGPSPGDPLWFRYGSGYYAGQQLGRVDLAATGPGSPVPPGMSRLPAAGEYYVSPALGDLLDSVPAGELADRFPGRRAGVLGDDALTAPGALLVVVGRTPQEMAPMPWVKQATSIPDTVPALCNGCVTGIGAAGMNLVLGVVAVALLFPVLMFIGTATRLSATRREQRFAAMRLVGATPRQVSVIAAVEAAVSAVVGMTAGFALFLACRDALAAIPFTGAPFFPSDFTPGLLPGLLVAAGVPLVAAAIAQVALRRVRISPLGVSRQATPRPPRAWRLIPLLLGLAELLYFTGRRPATSMGQTLAYLPGLLIIMGGLVFAGPWLTMTGARVAARLARRPAALIAARRLADNPKAAFRAVSGLVLALFVTTVAAGVLSTIVAERAPETSGPAVANVTAIFRDGPPADASPPPALATAPGVRGVVTVHEVPLETPGPEVYEGEYPPYTLASCAEIATSPGFGRCAPGAQVAWVNPDVVPPGAAPWPTSDLTPAALAALPVGYITVSTDGSRAAVERARTLLETRFPERYGPGSTGEFEAEAARLFDGWKRLADVTVVATLVIAGCSLAAAVTGGLSDRRRPFSLLRLAGAPLAVLRRVVALESSVPLFTAAVVAIGAGFAAAHLFLRAQMHYDLTLPGASYWVLTGVGILASLGIIASTLPLLRRITGPGAVRNE